MIGRRDLMLILVSITYLISNIYLTSMFEFLFTPKNHSIKSIAEKFAQHEARVLLLLMIVLTIILVPGK